MANFFVQSRTPKGKEDKGVRGQKALESIAKHFPVKCMCGAEMTITHTCTAYNTTYTWCDGCKNKMGVDEYSYHCTKGNKSSLHPSGYDYCFECAVKQFHDQREDKLPDQLNIIVNKKYDKINSENINKLMDELESLQFKQLQLMQTLDKMCGKSTNNDDEKQNNNQNIKKLKLSQSTARQNINSLQKMVNTQKSLTPLTLKLLNDHQKSISNWKEWSITDVIIWMINVNDGAYKKYSVGITEGATEENVRGKALIVVNDSMLHRWGIKDAWQRHELLTAIKSLTTNTNPGAPGSTAISTVQPEGQ